MLYTFNVCSFIRGLSFWQSFIRVRNLFGQSRPSLCSVNLVQKKTAGQANISLKSIAGLLHRPLVLTPSRLVLWVLPTSNMSTTRIPLRSIGREGSSRVYIRLCRPLYWIINAVAALWLCTLRGHPPLLDRASISPHTCK